MMDMFQVPFKGELMAELKFIAKCSGNTKTVRHRKSTSTQSRQSNASDRSNASKDSDANRRYREKS